MYPLALYSPVNFLIGLQVCLAGRSSLSHGQALAEAQSEAPNWKWRILASLLTGVLILIAITLALPTVAEPAMEGLAAVTSAKGLAAVTGLVLTGLFAWVAVKLARRTWQFYVRMCLMGYQERLRA